MALINRATLRTLTRQYCDQEGGTLCTDTEINTYLGLAYQEYHDKLTTLFEDYFGTVSTITALLDSTGYYIPLPSDENKLRKIEFQYVGTWQPIDRTSLSEAHRYNTVFLTGAAPTRAYFVYGANIRLCPDLQASGDYRVWYAQRCPGFSDDTTGTVDDQQGWYEMIPLSAAKRCMRKEDGDTSQLMQDLMLKIAQIEQSASQRDAAGPAHVTDSWCDNEWGSMRRFP